MKDDGSKFYYLSNTSDTVHQATLGTVWSIDPAPTSAGLLSVVDKDTQPEGLSFKPDGTKMYIIGPAADKVFQYSLSIAWDITSASFETDFIVSGQEAGPQGIAFKPDGTMMFIVGTSGDGIDSYNLGTAWDVSTAVADQFNALQANPEGLYIRADGQKLYLCLTSVIYEYDFTTPWDVSTLTLVDSINVSAQSTTMHGISFSTDGSRMFLISVTNNSIYQYNLTVSWDVTSAIYSPEVFYIALQRGSTTDIFIKPDGTKMFFTDITSDTVYQVFLGP
jgi:sugar lactone lactonase YvrE